MQMFQDMTQRMIEIRIKVPGPHMQGMIMDAELRALLSGKGTVLYA
jgi:hypothetical protein